jgi:hypothetical protein
LTAKDLAAGCCAVFQAESRDRQFRVADVDDLFTLAFVEAERAFDPGKGMAGRGSYALRIVLS